MEFNYLTIERSTGYSFFVIPKHLVKDPKFKKISTDAKLLYSLLLDRSSLSISNGWIDDDNHVYIIYSTKEIIEDLGCSKNTVTKFFKELSDFGLVEKKRQGLNRPDLIYVKDFTSEIVENENNMNDESTGNSVNSTVSPESQNLGIRNPKIWESGITKIGNQESQNLGTNKTNMSNTKINKTEEVVDSTNLQESETSSENSGENLELVLSTILDRKLNGMEKSIVAKWVARSYSADLIRLAASDNLYRKNFNVTHIDTTLDTWYEADIETTADAKKYIEKMHNENKRKLARSTARGKSGSWKTGAEAGLLDEPEETPKNTVTPSKENKGRDVLLDLYGDDEDEDAG